MYARCLLALLSLVLGGCAVYDDAPYYTQRPPPVAAAVYYGPVAYSPPVIVRPYGYGYGYYRPFPLPPPPPHFAPGYGPRPGWGHPGWGPGRPGYPPSGLRPR